MMAEGQRNAWNISEIGQCVIFRVVEWEGKKLRALQVGQLQHCFISLSVLLPSCSPTFNPAWAAPIALSRTSFIVVKTAYRTKTELRQIPERLSEENDGQWWSDLLCKIWSSCWGTFVFRVTCYIIVNWFPSTIVQ